jgi:acyl carrier protein
VIDNNHKIKAFVVENFLFGDDTGLDDYTSFVEKGIVDSTGILELVEYISTEFQITIDDTELLPENFDSIDKIAAFIGRKDAQAVA